MFLHDLDLVLTLFAALLLVPAIVFCVQCLAAQLPSRRVAEPLRTPRPRLAVIMPAHNEAAGIATALNSIQPGLLPGDRLLVVADNCTDGTASVASLCGAEVIERVDAEQRGKGFALDFGLRHLADTAPDIVIIFDSDCHAQDGMIDALARQVAATSRPAQAVYLLSRPTDPEPRDAVSAFAFMVKNLVRPRGLARLGLPCMLTGTGMAFPWNVIREARLATGNIVEDLQLSIELTLAGHAPLLCPDARVTGQLPRQGRAARTQRTRWEHGYLQTAIHCVPQLFAKGMFTINRELLSVALDLAVPPLALLVVVMLGTLLTSSAAAMAGAPWRLPAITAAGLLAVATCVIAAWARFGRDTLPPSALLACPLYVAGKLPIYLNFIFHRQTSWIRTERDDNGDDDNSLDGKPPAPRLPTILLQDVRFHSITEADCIGHVLEELGHNRGGMLVTPNLDHLSRCRTDAFYARLIAEADIVVADGMPLVWASRLQRTPLPERVAGSDLISSLSEAAAAQGRSIFLLGGNPGAAERSAQVLTERYPGLRVHGTHCPPLGFDYNPEALAELIEKLTALQPDIVYVGLGSPKQERLIHELREWLPGSWWLGVGYSFSFLAGEGQRAPLWMQRIGLEWMHRLASEPKRLARRYLVDGIPFAMRLLGGSLFAGLTGRARREVAARPSVQPLVSTTPARKPVRNPGRDQVISLVQQSFGVGFGNEWMRPLRSSIATRSPTLPRISQNRKLRAFVILGGSIRPTPFRAAINRSILDMPLEEGRRLLLHWQQQAVDLANVYRMDQLPIRVLVDRDSHLPVSAKPIEGCAVSIERDRAEYRGTGGILRDLADDYDDDDFILVVNGGQILTSSLPEMTHQLHEIEADVSFVAHQDGTPSGLMLVRCEALRMISARGYVDMKEQALPAIARRFRVAHLDQRRPTGMPLHSFQDYLAGVRWWHQVGRGDSAGSADGVSSTESRRRETRSSFCIVEPGAAVDPGAYLHDCVVLRGAKVGAGAVVARSVLCAGSVLAPNETAVDELLPGGSSATAPRRRILQTA